MLSLGINDQTKKINLTKLESINWQQIPARHLVVVGHDTAVGEILEAMESEADYDEAVRNFGASNLKLYYMTLGA